MTRITGKTVNADLDQDVITFQIAGVERGRITSSSSTLGFTVGSSYLNATFATVSGISSAQSAAASFSAIASAGSDIAINSSSSTVINILTTGWYSIWANIELSSDNPPTFPLVTGRVIWTSDASETHTYAACVLQGSVDGFGYFGPVPAVPAANLTAGATLTLRANAETLTNGATWTMSWDAQTGDPVVRVVRLA